MTRAPRESGLPPGYDEEDPYADEDLDDYPNWWRRNILEFREYGLRPYRPARFNDGVLVPPLIQELNDRWDVEISLYSKNPHAEGKWQIQDQNEVVSELERERVGEGYTMYDISSNEFVGLIQGDGLR